MALRRLLVAGYLFKIIGEVIKFQIISGSSNNSRLCIAKKPLKGYQSMTAIRAPLEEERGQRATDVRRPR
jgi:hypothetical protein